MEKRYQVFVSSTFVDLHEARGKVFQTLMEMDCIPAGMELFPAMDEEQMQFIKRIIDDCDYYLLILGGRYGSVSAEGISYTEMEYDYAIEKGLKVLAFVHEKPEEIPAKFTDSDPALRAKLDAFREKVRTGRLVRSWNDLKELPGLVSLSLNKTIRTYPAIGWVRANQVSSVEAVQEQNELLKELEVLRKELQQQKSNAMPVIEGLAGLDEQFQVQLTSYSGMDTKRYDPSLTWREIFVRIAPDLQVARDDGGMGSLMGQALLSHIGVKSNFRSKVENECFKTIRTQLAALGLIRLVVNGEGAQQTLTWEITPEGLALMLQERTVKSSGG
ncbi:MAG: DUF4062 domain-containing protein [Alphaproteobacteria bacterium]|nr:DUF4062 domain-containing protein [Rhizobiaceae bacterium]MBU3960092.1 DUF4062 domain-containing protein [Alphaproteobacteria bacterium]MBU4051099.1 DUF4062 domain-containing protein [Alphaproteobacteria bacterium]MBU4090485.1 DUF4062 domain-containing protein [Alphaproteobacteria bacterium]MBU4155855.1 DUF4062 domain-containing protein [Alphaproteobacteria bacterium]